MITYYLCTISSHKSQCENQFGDQNIYILFIKGEGRNGGRGEQIEHVPRAKSE